MFEFNHSFEYNEIIKTIKTFLKILYCIHVPFLILFTKLFNSLLNSIDLFSNS